MFTKLLFFNNFFWKFWEVVSASLILKLFTSFEWLGSSSYLVVIELFLYSLVCLSWLCPCICSRSVKGECDLRSCHLPLTDIKTEYAITVLRQTHRYRKCEKPKEDWVTSKGGSESAFSYERLQTSKRTMPCVFTWNRL